MDGQRFDDLTRTFFQRASQVRGSRRAALRGFIGGLLGVAVGVTAVADDLDLQFDLVEDVDAATPKKQSCALQTYTKNHGRIMAPGSYKKLPWKGSKLESRTCIPIKADVQFFSKIPIFHTCALEAGVHVCVHDAYREKPSKKSKAKFSAHLVGHALDVKLVYTDKQGKERWCNGGDFGDTTQCLAKSDRPDQANAFIACMQRNGFRWCGDGTCGGMDAVHFDDYLFGDTPAWRARREAMLTHKECDTKCLTCDSKGVCQPKTGATTGDCNGDGTCEMSLTTTRNCGACGVRCTADQVCKDGKCIPKSAEICPGAGGRCDHPEEWYRCGPGNQCWCGVTDQGRTCFPHELCDDVPICSRTSDCGAGKVCLTSNCCPDGKPRCITPCSSATAAEVHSSEADDRPSIGPSSRSTSSEPTRRRDQSSNQEDEADAADDDEPDQRRRDRD